MLLCRQHEDSEDQHGREEHLDEETPHDRRIPQLCADAEGAGEETRYDAGRRNTCDQLRYEDEAASKPADGADEAHSQRDLAKNQLGMSRKSNSMGIYCWVK